MKKIVLIVLLLWAGFAHSQSFEGTITYVLDFEVSEKFKKMGVTKEMLIEKMKAEGSYSDTIKTSYKQGDYYTLLNANPKSWQIYKASTNKIYAMQDGEDADICKVIDASVDLEFTMTGKMPVIQKLDTTANVNGNPCSIVRVKWQSGTYDYYYDSRHLKVDLTLFAQHTYDGWAEYLKISRALPVKIVKTVNGLMTATQTMTSARVKAVDESLFVIPTLVPDKELNIFKMPNGEIMRIKK